MTTICMPELPEHWHNARKKWVQEASRQVQHIPNGWYVVEELASRMGWGEFDDDSWTTLPLNALAEKLHPDWVKRWEVIDELQRRSYLEMSVYHQIRGSYPYES